MYVIKTEVTDVNARTWTFKAQKTMYGGKHISKGDQIFIFASENDGGHGLIAGGTVSLAEATPRTVDVERETPRVSIEVERIAQAQCRLGRNELRPFNEWNDGRPETELNFKFYRQATNKIGGISPETAAFLQGLMQH